MSVPEAGILAFAHIGDPHVTDADQPNYADLRAITAQIERHARFQLDFVVLPGDCAENGLLPQYALVATALSALSVPVHVVPGDHDMEQGGLANFHAGLAAAPLPKSLRLKGHRCIFLDFCSAGGGGPDFRLGGPQLGWLEAQLGEAAAARETPILFAHGYPADLRGEQEPERLNRLIADHGVALVDMGHTHYNELANDGTTIFAATRSTGQIEEGPVGYSVTTLDGGVVAWRFRTLDDPWPFVMITTPADHRLLRGLHQRVEDACEVGARVLGAEPVARVEFRLDTGPWRPMRRVGEGPDWRAPLGAGAGPWRDLTVRAVTIGGETGLHRIRPAGPDFVPDARAATGSDAAALGAWPENGILGTQLGPNRNGRPW